jgi:tetratricopeptide (TPR) repeat protein
LNFQVPPFIFLEGLKSYIVIPETSMLWFLRSALQNCFFIGLTLSLLPLAGTIAVSPIWAQVAPARRPTRPVDGVPVGQAEAELQARRKAAQEARQAGDASAVAQANKRLVALALREMGQLRLLEGAYPQATDLYKRSLDFEDVPDTHADLAIVAMQANRPDDAVSESEAALAGDKSNVRANIVLGRALMNKQQFAKAAEALSRAVQIEPSVETFYSLGISLLATKTPEGRQRAASAFQQMMEFAGDSGSLHVLFGRAYRDDGDMTAAIRELERAIQLDPRTPHAHYFLGLARLSLNEWKATPEAKAEIAKEAEYYPRDFLANYMMGFLASAERDYPVSNRYLDVAAEMGEQWPEPWLYMGLNAYAQNDMKRAEECFRKAIELTGKDESRSNYQIRRAYVDLARILTTSGRTEEAEIYVAKARELQNKTMEQSQQNVAAVAAAAGALSTAAIVPINPQRESQTDPLLATSTDPFTRVDASAITRVNLTKEQRVAADAQESQLRSVLALSFNDLATSEAIRGEYLAALGHYQEAERWDPRIPGLAKNLGLSAFRAKNYPESIRGFSRALEESPTEPSVRAMLGMAYFGSDKYADAARTFSPLGQPGMQDATIGYAWANALAQAGEFKKAGEVLAEFEKGSRSNDTLLLIGQLWVQIGDYARAVSTLHRVSQSDPNMPKVHYFAGQADIRWERWMEAAAEFQAELALVPTDADAKYNLGFVYLQQSKTDQAATLFQQVVAARPDHANAQYQMGKILMDRGELRDAIEHLETAARLSPQTDYMHYQLQVAYRKESRTADADRELEIYKELKAKQRERAAAPSQQSP